MKLPRDVTGDEAVRAFQRIGFRILRQRGSHVQMTDGSRHVTVPAHDAIRPGTLKSMLRQAGMSVDEFVEQL